MLGVDDVRFSYPRSPPRRVCAHALGFDLLRLERGRLFSGIFLGESEANRRHVTATERTATVALRIDTLEKGLRQRGRGERRRHHPSALRRRFAVSSLARRVPMGSSGSLLVSTTGQAQ
ncbi:hypothetical protein SAMN02745121_06544 [Nannocystis exedens]|uniref:Uncharacterized protein n=2 Tax=Nannocystis exedens TaxID=54 RepID=A0A1I2F9E5_9BACT|nr:hypothetical protein NAEX_06080 [Nannocystis exedens]SFF01805.1 hypothetical protein SAMN02745121_06544 [Nannocystis exedens]